MPFDSIEDLTEQLVHRILAPNRNSLIKAGYPRSHLRLDPCPVSVMFFPTTLEDNVSGGMPMKTEIRYGKRGQGRAVCFPNGPTGECMTEEYLQRITGLSAKEIRDLIDQLPASCEVSA